MTQTANPTSTVAAYAAELGSEALSPEVLDRTKQLFLDFLGVALGGMALGPGMAELRLAAQRLAGSGGGPCTVVGNAATYPAPYAALLNAAHAHSMDFDDTHRDTVSHPGTPLFAGLLAVGEPEGVSGLDFLTAAALGYELNGKLGKAHGDRVHQRGFHPTATTGLFVVTAAAGRLVAADQQTIAQALGIALSLAAGTAQFSESGGANKPVQVGMAAHNALYCLTMAQAGVPGTRQPLEGTYGYYAAYAEPGSDLSKIAFDPAGPSEVLNVAVKPYPSCRCSHAAIDGVSTLVQQERLQPEEIESIAVMISPASYQLVGGEPEQKRRPATVVDAQFSGYFAAAVAACEPSYTWDSYGRLDDPRLQRIMDRTEVHRTETLAGLASEVTLAARGQSWTLPVPFPKGEPEVPLTWDEVEEKFRSLASRVLSTAAVDEVTERVRGLEGLGSITELTRVLRGHGRG